MRNGLPVVLEAQHLTKVFSSNSRIRVKAVDDVSLEAREGEVLLISGPNGSGKTTLLSIIGCLVEPGSGSLRIRGNDVTGLDQSALTLFRLQHVGFIFQSFRLLDSLTARENVEIVLNLAGGRRPESLRRADALLEELEIFHRASFAPKSLSGGEKQRVAIARALANDPFLILADEPTGSLDSQAGQKTIELLCGAARRHKKTVVVVSHDPRIQHYADRVVRMEDGRITGETRQ
jgi:putative ABC transport system ATP-binding protein